jgi:hypothetical protein
MDALNPEQMSPLDLERLQVKRLKKAVLLADLGKQIHAIETELTSLQTEYAYLPFKTWSVNRPYTVKTDRGMATADVLGKIEHLQTVKSRILPLYHSAIKDCAVTS